MWPDTPDQRFTYITQRQAELRAEAASNRLRPRRVAGPRVHRVQGVHIHLGTLMILVGRTLCDEESRLPDAAH
jgi:hypothetical protein